MAVLIKTRYLLRYDFIRPEPGAPPRAISLPPWERGSKSVPLEICAHQGHTMKVPIAGQWAIGSVDGASTSEQRQQQPDRH